MAVAPFGGESRSDGFYTILTFVSRKPEASAPIASLIGLCHHRWTVPVLAELDRTGGTRAVTLMRRLDVGRESLQRTLDALIERGLVRRNPGYGHPLRPEYLLTERGCHVGPSCRLLLDGLRALDLESVGLNKWSVPVLVTLCAGDDARAQRFSELRERLPGISPRALTLALKALTDAGVVDRTVLATFPPATTYELARRGRALEPAVRGVLAAAA
jgi:DNA-binding HxlR family transcriptional regulator